MLDVVNSMEIQFAFQIYHLRINVQKQIKEKVSRKGRLSIHGRPSNIPSDLHVDEKAHHVCCRVNRPGCGSEREGKVHGITGEAV